MPLTVELIAERLAAISRPAPVARAFLRLGHMENLRERVSRLVAEQFHVDGDRINEAARLDEDLGATGPDRVEVVTSLEDEFRHRHFR